jgi:hypothetical protein
VAVIRSEQYFAIIPEALLYDKQISANAVRLYGILNRYANNQGKAWPSRKTLADQMALSVATVDRAKEELEGAGWLTVEHRLSASGDHTSNVYTLYTTSSPVTRGGSTSATTGSPTGDDLKRVNKKQSQKKGAPSYMRACPICLGRYRAGYDDGTEGLSHIFNNVTREYELCSKCDGMGEIYR